MFVSFIVFNIKSTVSKSFISSTLRFIEKFSSLFWNVLQALSTTIFVILEYSFIFLEKSRNLYGAREFPLLSISLTKLS